MKISPVKFYKKPNYPTRDYFILNSAKLKDHVPVKWRKNKIITGALAVLIFGSVNNKKDEMIKKEKIVFIKNKNEGINENTEIISRKTIPSIAPIFIHGDGRGATGCVVMNPPVFLTEEEARQVIETELKKENIIFDKKNLKINEISFPKKWGYNENEADTVIMDGYSSKYNIAYEFISADDYLQFGGEWDGSTVHSYDLVKAGENLRNKMKEYGKLNTAIFYDPMMYPDNNTSKNSTYRLLVEYNNLLDKDIDNEENKGKELGYSKYEKQSKNYSKKSIELLKQQVRDFLEWIKKEGILKEK